MDDSIYKSRIRAWCLYDWANSAFVTTVMAALLPIFFRDVAATTLPQSNHQMVTSIWGYTTSAAMLIVGILSLILGPVADFGSSKKRFLAAFILLGTVSTALLGLTGAGDWLAVVVLFILGNIGFAGSEVFYDSMLPHLARPGDMDRISTLGYALGYVGGGILLVLNIGMIAFLPSVSILPGGPEVPLLGMRLSFVSVAVWWAAFSIPLFLRVPEPPGVQHGLGGENPMRIAVRRLSYTFRNIRGYRNLFLFILAFWFYNDGIGTIIKMAAVYGKEIGIGTMDMVGALLLTQVIGVPCSIGFGKLAGRIKAKRAILAGLVVYAGISIGGYFMTRALHFWILASAVGLVQGGTQGLSRSLYGALLPREKSSEFFGFFNISGKFAGIAGPAVFGLAGQLSGSSRLGVLSLIFFFIVGGCLLLFVKEAEPARP
jgi:UMF1 family MFS transporter